MSKSESLFTQAQALIPGGVNSPVRAFSGVGGTPYSSRVLTALSCLMPMVKPTSTTWVHGDRWCLAITMLKSAMR